jgi:O-antigen/teichoic acid export membrane protein
MILSRLNALFDGDSLKARALRGSALTFLNFGGAMFLRLASNLILTRILFPEAFGLMALVQVVILGLGMFSVTGVKSAIIQNKRGDDPQFLNTAWMVQIGRGFFLWLLTIALAGPAASLYEQPLLAVLLPVAGLTAVMNGFQSTNMSTANRNLTLGRMTFMELFSQLAGIIIMVALALITGSVWSLVIGSVATEAIKMVLSHIILPGIRNRPAWDKDAFWQIFHFGKYIFVGSVAGFLINTGDRAILGKFVTLTELAVYNIGYFLATVPAKMAQRFGSKVLMPVYARTNDNTDPETRKKQMIARAGLTGAMLGASLFLAVIGDWLVRFLYEPAYHLSGPILVLIALAYLPIILINPYSHRLLAMGNSRDATTFTVVQAVLQVLILFFGIRMFGLMGAIVAPALAVLLVYPLIAWMVQRKGVWEPKLDLAFLLVCLAGTALALWINDTVIAQVLAGAVDQTPAEALK